MKRQHLLYLLLQILFLTNFSQTADTVNAYKNKYLDKYEDLLFQNNHLDKYDNIDSIINWLHNDNRKINLYDKNDELTDKINTECINTIKFLNKNYYLIQDFYSSGEIKRTAVYRSKTDSIKSNKKYSIYYDSAKPEGKVVYFNKAGIIKYINYHVNTNWEKGFFYSDRLDASKYNKAFGNDFKTINKTNLKVEILYNSTKEENSYLVDEKDIKGIFESDLYFVFKNNSLRISHNGIKTARPKKMTGAFAPIYRSFHDSFDEFTKNSSLGRIKIKRTSEYCEYTNHNSFILESNDDALLIEGLDNLQVFIIDSNGDSNDEIFIFSYAQCDDWAITHNSLRIIKIGI